MKKLYLLSVAYILANIIQAQNVTAEWVRHTGDAGTDLARGMNIDLDGNIYITGSFEGGMDIDPSPDYHYLSASGTSDAFISKYNRDGILVWGRSVGGDGVDQGLACTIDTSGNVYTIGIYEGTADFDPGPGVVNLTGTAGDLDVFISKLDSNGNYVWAKKLGGSGGDQLGWSIALDNQGNIYSVGSFAGTCDFKPGTGTYNLTRRERYLHFSIKCRRQLCMGKKIWRHTK